MSTTITSNKTTIASLEAEEFIGSDASLAISLFEYGMAWRTLETGETVVVYGVGSNREGEYSRFDCCSFCKDCNVFKEFNWVKWEEFFKTLGVSAEKWGENDFGWKIFTLFCYYGHENVFGTSHGTEFKIYQD